MMDEDDIATGEFAAVEMDDEGNLVIPKVSDEWLWDMNAAVTRMKRTDGFSVEMENTFRPVPDVLREHVETAAGMVAAPTVASFFSVTDGYELVWSYEGEDEETKTGGRIHIFGFAEVFGSWLGTVWGEHPDDAPDTEIDFTWELRAFDEAAPESDYLTVMHVPEMLPTYNLYWYAPHGKKYRLRVDFLEYLDCLTETCGLHGWQYMLCVEEDIEGDEEALEQIATCTRWMRTLFPDVDLSRYNTAESDD